MRKRKLKGQTPNEFRIDGSIAYIKLPSRNGVEVHETKVDVHLLGKILAYGRWYLKANSDCTTNHVSGESWVNGKKSRILLHRFVVGFLSVGVIIDHRNGDGLDNTVDNLAVVTHEQNSRKRAGADRDSLSGVRGVRRESVSRRWLARAKVHGVIQRLGRFETQEAAQEAVSSFWREHQSYDGSTERLIRVHAILRGSTVNGPGERYVIWTQGCRKGCLGCFNEETWAHSRGVWWSPEALAQDVQRSGLEGLTATGGDPLEQPAAFLAFLRELHDENGLPVGLPKGIICFTGYTMEEVRSLSTESQCLPYIDLLIDGRYVSELRHASGLAGSSNQNFNFSECAGRGRALIPESEIAIDQGVEVFGGENGTVEVTGFPAIDRKWLRKLGLKVVQ